MNTTIKMSATVAKLLTSVRDGTSYRGSAITYTTAMGAGWLVWEDTYKRMESGEYGRGYVLTDAGKEALAAKTAVKCAAPHAANCSCPPCLVAHVRNGRRKIGCKVCFK